MQTLILAAVAVAGWSLLARRSRQGGGMAGPGAGARRSIFDRTHGVDTDGDIALARFDVAPEIVAAGERYQPTDQAALVEAIAFTRVDPGRFTFVDLGCGKGRALIIAGRLGFRRVIGVEVVPELAAIARQNLATLSLDKVVVETQDAGDFTFPPGPVIVFLYNPFHAAVIEKVVGHLRNAGAAEIFVIYKNPRYAALLDRSGFLEPMKPPPSRDARHFVQVWRNIAAGAAA